MTGRLSSASGRRRQLGVPVRVAIVAALGLAAGSLGATPLALGQGDGPSRRDLGIDFRPDRVPLVTFGARDLADRPAVREKLRSGLAQTLAMRVWARRAGGDDAIARSAQVCSVVYDVWEESWRVERSGPAGSTTERAGDLREVLGRCLVARRLPVGEPRDWRGQAGRRVYFAVLVELNRPSSATVRRIRRWLTQSGGGAGLDRGDAFFGSFVAMFVDRRVGGAEATLRFRSQEVPVP